MNALASLNGYLDEFDAALGSLDGISVTLEGVVQSYVAVAVQRLRSGYQSIRILLDAGRHEEAVVLFRRQHEESMRLHYLSEHPERADSLVLGHLRAREARVQSRIDWVINHTDDDEKRQMLVRLSGGRRSRVQELDNDAAARRTSTEDFPRFEEMAVALQREVDVVPYASASEVLHSVVSAATEAYLSDQDEVRLIGLTSGNVADRVEYARAAVNSTGIGVVTGLRILNMREHAETLARKGASVVGSLIRLREQLGEEEVADDSG